MANIFKEQQAINDHPNRNNFDLSKKSNVSLKFGTLYPVYCQPVVPGDSFSIDTAFNLKLMPVVFPVQTKMRAHMHYFYVRNKNLWSNWENWISNLVGQSDHPHPYISLPDEKFKNGSIHDFLGVPTSLVAPPESMNVRADYVYTNEERYVFSRYMDPDAVRGNKFKNVCSSSLSDSNILATYTLALPVRPYSDKIDVYLYGSEELGSYNAMLMTALSGEYLKVVFSHGSSVNESTLLCDALEEHLTIELLDTEQLGVRINLDASLKEIFANVTDNIYLTFLVPIGDDYIPAASQVLFDNQDGYWSLYNGLSQDVVEYSDLHLPLYSQNLHINALAYRAYESIFYAYYNNNVLNPLKINGQVQYNRYNTNLGDGADTTDYHLFQRNYELDFLTSALPSPQQGVAPVVGMTALGDVTIEDENGITTAHAEVDNDGTITKVVLTSPAASNEHARTAMNIAACGMSINDFRSTNALQRLLETNIRKGYRYLDFIAGHFGKEPEYRELDMPEFIGGFSRDVSVSTVVSNADTLGVDNSGAALGEYGGYAQVVGGSNHSVRHYCDDYGYIIGILSVVPTPCYSQLLPKHMIAPDNFLDYYFPSMSQLGLQPITYKEVAPIQSFIDGLVDSSKSLEDTFGYQRPNYDMVSAVDELHGEFRGSLKDWVINRIFDSRPELGQSFISINPSEINDIFVNTSSDEDTIIGEIGFSVHAKRPVPRVVIPNLGR